MVRTTQYTVINEKFVNFDNMRVNHVLPWVMAIGKEVPLDSCETRRRFDAAIKL